MIYEYKKRSWDKSGKQLYNLLEKRLKDLYFSNSVFVKKGLWMIKQKLTRSIIEKKEYILKKYCS